MKIIFFYLLLSLCLFSQNLKKKIIYYGWGTRDTIYVKENWKEIEKMPFDGIGIIIPIDRKAWIEGKRDTGNSLSWHIFGPDKFKYEDFTDSINDIKGIKWEKFKDNFMPVCKCSKDQDHNFNWFDDERWKTIYNNWEILIRIVKETKCKGIMLDPEQYGAYFFYYPDMKARYDKTFEEYKNKVEKREGN